MIRSTPITGPQKPSDRLSFGHDMMDRQVEMRFIRIDEVVALTGMSEPTVRRRIRSGVFPRQRHNGRISFWVHSEIVDWMNSQLQVA